MAHTGLTTLTSTEFRKIEYFAWKVIITFQQGKRIIKSEECFNSDFLNIDISPYQIIK